jgi:predicted nucleic acid-binding protein
MSDPVFDTCILIDWLMDRPQAIVELGRYKRHRISRISWVELLAAEPLESRPQLIELLSAIEVIEMDARIAAAAADIRSRSRMGLANALVLASAQVSGAILVTRNTRDFPAQMPGIRVPYVL